MRVRVNDGPRLARVARQRRDDGPGHGVIAAQHEDAQVGVEREEPVDDPLRHRKRRDGQLGRGVGTVERLARGGPLAVAQHVVVKQVRDHEDVADVDDALARRDLPEGGTKAQRGLPHALGPVGRAAHEAGAAVGRNADDRDARLGHRRERFAPARLDLGGVGGAVELALQVELLRPARADRVEAAARGPKQPRELGDQLRVRGGRLHDHRLIFTKAVLVS